jgi:TolB-like protein
MNRFVVSIFAVLVLAVASVSAFGAGQPTTAPAVVAKGSPRVEIFAFTPISLQPGQTDWIGRGIQESLQSEVAHTGATLMIPVHAPTATDDAITVARQNQADLAVIGTYQVVGDDVRVNGHLVDAASNSTVGSFSATGPQKSLFSLEDALGEQLRRLLPAAPLASPMPAQQPDAAPQPTVSYQQPAQLYSPPPSVNYYYDSAPDSGYYYPGNYGYAYSYPFGFYGGIGIYGGGYYRGGYGGRGFVGHPAFAGHGGGFAGHGGFGGGHAGFGGGGHGGGGHR